VVGQFLEKDKLVICNQWQAKVDLMMSKVMLSHIWSCKREVFKHKIPGIWRMVLILILMKMEVICNWEVQANLMALVIIKVELQFIIPKKKTLVSKKMLPLQATILMILMMMQKKLKCESILCIKYISY